jgi:S1-C subfamily serine protease
MRIDGVTDGKPASKAGLQPGDVVVQIGEHRVLDMMSYMKALGKFNRGDAVKIKIRRGNQELEKDVVF